MKTFVSETRSREVKSWATHSTNTRIGCRLSLPQIGRGIMPPAYRWKRRFAVFRSRSLCVYNRKISPGRFFWVVRNGSLLRGLFSYKSPLFCKPIFDLQNSPAKALEPQRISSPAEHDQQAVPAGHPPPFEKGGRKLFLYLKVLVSPTFLVMPRLSQYSKIATANLREAPIRSRISARVICPFLATCSLAISSALL